MAIKTVAVVGASGNIGSHATKALLDAGFTVTAITRPDSKSTFPDNVQVRRADPTSFEDVKAALEGQDAVIAAAATNVAATGEGQDVLIDAAVAAGVKRFLPSEYGHASDRFPEGEILGKLLQGKAKTLKYVQEKAKANPGFSWTGVGTSYFFDWGLDVEQMTKASPDFDVGLLGFNIPQKKATIFDSGNEIWSTTSLPFIGRAIAAVLLHEEETKNQYVDVVEFQTSQNQILKALEDETGVKFAITRVDTAETEKNGHEKLAKGDQRSFLDFLRAWAFRDGRDDAVPDAETANRLLGLPEPSHDVREAVREFVRRS